MFLCPPCHKAGGCTQPPWFESPSRGVCERCRKSDVCSDCHSYDFRAADKEGERDG